MKKTKKFEYFILTREVCDNDMEVELNQFGAEGWKVVSSFKANYFSGPNVRFVLEREVK